jgi:carbamoyltransferase
MYSNLVNPKNPNDWHEDESELTETAKNLAWRVQHDTQNAVASLVQEAITRTNQKNIVFSGGYGMNCVTNYFLKQEFPEVNFWFDPICNDAGTPIGLAKKHWHEETQDTTIRPLTSLYFGKQRDIYQDHGMVEADILPQEVAQLIVDNNIVTVYQGGSEIGPRALGNRSILFDPTDPEGKAKVNIVKKREWFRPFAATILHENFEEWFETAGIEESPFMMYALKIKNEYVSKVPAVSHVDGTCRVQTLKREQNPHYYDLIKAFYGITGVPMVLNTSFNLAGEPLVETFRDAVKTVKNSKINYLYLPEKCKLLSKS